MAHENVYERQRFVHSYIKENGNPTPAKRKEFASLFGCHYSAIYADVVAYHKPKGIGTYASSSVKKVVKLRDNNTCQYCGTKQGIIIEHVVPSIIGGVGRPYNLVCACNSCNSKKKGGKVWIPRNFDVLKKLNPEYARKIKILSVKDCRKKQYVKVFDFSIY